MEIIARIRDLMDRSLYIPECGAFLFIFFLCLIALLLFSQSKTKAATGTGGGDILHGIGIFCFI